MKHRQGDRAAGPAPRCNVFHPTRSRYASERGNPAASAPRGETDAPAPTGRERNEGTARNQSLQL
jgi:hypothetical protein